MKTFDLTVTRTVRASADEVFDVWLDPKSPGGLWFGVERAIVNTVVDGLFYHSVKHEGRSWPHYGRFVRLERGRTIEYTWVSEATRGLESLVTITLVPGQGRPRSRCATSTSRTTRWATGTRTAGRGTWTCWQSGSRRWRRSRVSRSCARPVTSTGRAPSAPRTSSGRPVAPGAWTTRGSTCPRLRPESVRRA